MNMHGLRDSDMTDRIEEYDDGYDSAASFERAGADQPGDEEGDGSDSEREEIDDRVVLRRQEQADDALAYQTLLARVRAYNEELNRLEIAPNGDDYNELYRIIEGQDRPLPTEGDR